ncbi:MAG: hypothetical protein K0Q49_768 [Haloplasmataceae bacterium]|nr:hypothetical protein [Haloplasmataceae bacterium]
MKKLVSFMKNLWNENKNLWNENKLFFIFNMIVFLIFLKLLKDGLNCFIDICYFFDGKDLNNPVVGKYTNNLAGLFFVPFSLTGILMQFYFINKKLMCNTVTNIS